MILKGDREVERGCTESKSKRERERVGKYNERETQSKERREENWRDSETKIQTYVSRNMHRETETER